MLSTQFPEIDDLINQLSNSIKTIFASELVGIYVFGSLVVGDFDPIRSDFDLLVIVSEDISPRQLDNLKIMHASFVKRHPEWDDRVEVTYVPLKGMQNFKTQSCGIARISPGEPLHFRSMDKDWLMDWYAVRNYGQKILGANIEEVVPYISLKEFKDSLKSFLPNWLLSAKQANHIGYQSYIILSLCRSLYVFVYSRQISKKQAGIWACTIFPQWKYLIENALEWHGSADKTRNVESRKNTEDFVKFMIGEVDKIY